MTPLSDRQHDAFDNAAKMACREGNLRVLREAAYLLWEDAERTRLRYHCCERQTGTMVPAYYGDVRSEKVTGCRQIICVDGYERGRGCRRSCRR